MAIFLLLISFVYLDYTIIRSNLRGKVKIFNIHVMLKEIIEVLIFCYLYVKYVKMCILYVFVISISCKFSYFLVKFKLYL